ncbi:MAG: MCP four helix bundle domain-containing protein, partial [Desulfuromonadales bacterium]
MSWYYNLKISVKLLSAFVVVALIALVIGVIGIVELKKLDDNGDKMYNKITVPISDLGDMSTAFQRIRINIRGLVEADNAAEKQVAIDTIKKLQADMSEKSAAFEKTILTEEGRKLFEEFKKSREGYGQIIDRVTPLAMADKDKEALDIIKVDGKKAAFFEQEMLDKLQEAKMKQAKLT